MYRCWKCNEKLEDVFAGKIYCPKCGSRIIFVERPSVSREIPAD